ncbi:hypothetical protein KSC_023170 [Ktedonobacter sp. SOSP1-52]|nr:hypothetical protein KSC_023170 [Ktedonobacter sp. SOSP1-52]
MSEAELFVLRALLQGSILNKARRGALKLTLPIGFTYTETDAVVLDPDLPRAGEHSRGLSQFCTHWVSFYDGPPLSPTAFAFPAPSASWGASRRTRLGRD